MSYILDAIRKSEQQRQRGVGPALNTVQISTYTETQPSLLLYGFVAAILICAGVLIGWLRPWQTDSIAPVTKPVAPALHDAEPPKAMPIQAPLLEPMIARKPEPPALAQESPPPPREHNEKNKMQDTPAPLKQAAPDRKAQPIIAGKAVPKEGPTPIAHEKIAPTVEKVITPAEAPTDSGANDTAQDQRIMAMSELPLSIQQEIPKMSISGYAYSSNPKERTVGINDRLLQEGESLTQGLRLERISPDGLVFSYKKYLFRQSLP